MRLAWQAPFGQLTGVALGPDGNPVLLDKDNCIAARIANAAVSVLAGNGICLTIKSGEGGPALDAVISVRVPLTVDAKGTLYVLTRVQGF